MPRAGVDLGLSHPAAQRLGPITQLPSHPDHRPRRSAQLGAQREHHPHRVLFLLSRIPTRRRRRPRICVHRSHARSNPWSLRETVKMWAGNGPSASDLAHNWPCVLRVPCLGLVGDGTPRLACSHPSSSKLDTNTNRQHEPSNPPPRNSGTPSRRELRSYSLTEWRLSRSLRPRDGIGGAAPR